MASASPGIVQQSTFHCYLNWSCPFAVSRDNIKIASQFQLLCMIIDSESEQHISLRPQSMTCRLLTLHTMIRAPQSLMTLRRSRSVRAVRGRMRQGVACLAGVLAALRAHVAVVTLASLLAVALVEEAARHILCASVGAGCVAPLLLLARATTVAPAVLPATASLRLASTASRAPAIAIAITLTIAPTVALTIALTIALAAAPTHLGGSSW
jgi:hypothetical protein